MDAFASALNDLLVNTFHSILKLEEQSLRRLNGTRLSLNELHLLEVVAKGRDAGRSISCAYHASTAGRVSRATAIAASRKIRL